MAIRALPQGVGLFVTIFLKRHCEDEGRGNLSNFGSHHFYCRQVLKRIFTAIPNAASQLKSALEFNI
jgi:hypothetical protein